MERGVYSVKCKVWSVECRVSSVEFKVCVKVFVCKSVCV